MGIVGVDEDGYSEELRGFPSERPSIVLEMIAPFVVPDARSFSAAPQGDYPHAIRAPSLNRLVKRYGLSPHIHENGTGRFLCEKCLPSGKLTPFKK